MQMHLCHNPNFLAPNWWGVQGQVLMGTKRHLKSLKMQPPISPLRPNILFLQQHRISASMVCRFLTEDFAPCLTMKSLESIGTAFLCWI